MPLTLLLRTLCFALACAASLQMLFECLAWRLAPRTPEAAALGRARGLERRLFALTLAARLLPWLLTFGLLVPAYLRGEDNPATERVGLVSLLLAVATLAWIAASLLRAAITAIRTRQYCRTCHTTGHVIDGRPVLAHGGSRSLLAIAGVLRPRLLISQSLLDAQSPRLGVAFRHEAAHASQRDNLKLLLLSLLPAIPFATAARPSLDSRWRLASELAADEDATHGNAEHSLELAALLVSLARSHTATPSTLATLLSAPEHLTLRVERLLHHAQPGTARALPRRERDAATLVLAAGCLAALVCAAAAFGHRLAELLLHVG